MTESEHTDDIIAQYIKFCQKYDSLKEEKKTKAEKLQALKDTIKYCINHDILRDFLKEKQREVEEVMMGVFTQEQATDMILYEKYQEGRTEGITEGMEQGVGQGIAKVAKNLRNNGTDLKTIMECTGLSEEEIMKL